MPRQPSQQKRDSILDAAEKTFVERGYYETGIADIAQTLGMGHGTFYRYFKNKHDIALSVLDRAIATFAEVGLAENPEESSSLNEYRAQTQRILMGWVTMADERPRLVKLLFETSFAVDASRLDTMTEAYVEYTARFLRNGVSKGFLRKSLDVTLTSQMLVALIFEGCRRAMTTPDVEMRQRWVAAGMSLMFDGIRGR